MPFKNAAPFVAETVDSILAQTTGEWELVAVNDHSADDSMAILQRYAERDGRIRAMDNIGDGICAALGLALAKSTGGLVTRMDADDVMVPTKLARMAELMQRSSADRTVVVGLVRYFCASGPVAGGYQRYAQWLNDLSTKEANFTGGSLSLCVHQWPSLCSTMARGLK